MNDDSLQSAPQSQSDADATNIVHESDEQGAGMHPNPEAAIAQAALDPNSEEAELSLRDLSQGPFLSEMGYQLPALRRKLQELELQEAQVEAQEKARAQTPLAVTLQVVSCRWGTEHYSDDKMLPTIEVASERCPKRLTTTNQDCRDCAYIKLIAYGTQHEAAHTRRYSDHGMIIPVSSEEDAGKLASVLGAINMKPLRRIHHEIAAVKNAISQAEAAETQVRIDHLNLRRAQGAW